VKTQTRPTIVLLPGRIDESVDACLDPAKRAGNVDGAECTATSPPFTPYFMEETNL
jgi:hypothetical protein